MATTYKRFAKILFVVINFVAAVIFLMACAAPYLNPRHWWLVSLIGLGFAFVIVTLIAFILFWLVFNPRLILISIIPMLIGWKSISVFFAFHIPEKFDYNKPNDVLRIVHWNVASFLERKKNNNKGSQIRLKMMDQIKEQNADIVCMQEFFTSMKPDLYNNLNYVMKELGYPYFYYSWDNDGYLQWMGQVIFSRYPFIDTGMIRYSAPAMSESLIHADIVFNSDTIRIYTTHLQSVQFKKQDYERIEKIKENEDGMVQNSKSIFSKLKRALTLRCGQAEVVKEVTDGCRYPFILTGDFNDVPNSYTYFTIKNKKLQDAFLNTGFGVGRTYSYIAPTLRIDYIFTTKHFIIKQFNRIIKNYSDHYMLVSDLNIDKTKILNNP